MVTKTSPASAAANWVSVHSGRLSDQTPMRSPRRSPSASKPAARSRTRARSSSQVQATPWLGDISAGRSGQRAAASSSACPIVEPSNGSALTPLT